MTATHTPDSNTPVSLVLYMSLELGWRTWKVAFTVGLGQKPRLRTIPARSLLLLLDEIALAKKRFGLPPDTPVRCCYEAGRDGFWIDRFLQAKGIQNVVVDSASIEVNRRKRRVKSDRLDAEKLVDMLIRWHGGERKVWAIVQVPSAEDEDRRHLHRDLITLKAERTAHVNAIKGLLAGVGLHASVNDRFPSRLEELQQWDESHVLEGLRDRLLREFERWQTVTRQIRELEKRRVEQIRRGQTAQVEQMRRLLDLKGIGANGAWLLVQEFFSWRRFRNRRELASLAGLTPTPYDSGTSRREQGISKAGNRRVRWMMVQLAWGWLEYQPQSELSRWYRARFAGGGAAQRKIGIVAVARKLLVALWKYLETGEPPAGAELVGWDKKPHLQGVSLAKEDDVILPDVCT
jgi:transposase